MRTFWYQSLKTFLFFVFLLAFTVAFGQKSDNADTTRAKVVYHQTDSLNLKNDTIMEQTDASALDIGQDRGLFILSPDRLMQMRILGSVRALFTFSDQDMQDNLSFNPYEIPTSTNVRAPNFSASLAETRLGFEVTRHTKKRGDIFVRIEADFASSTNSFRIRHAYGQMNKFLIGQTYSLFANVNFVPATVSFSGPVGSIFIRTPQIRYSSQINQRIMYSVAMEYSTPDFVIPDSVNVVLLQVIPDFTGRISYKTNSFSLQLSGIITAISGRDTTNSIHYTLAFGGSLSGKVALTKNDNLYFSVTSGRAMAHMLDVFGGKGEDAAYDPLNQRFYGFTSTAGFIAYEHNWPQNLSSNLSIGIASISNRDFQTANEYSYSYNALLNVFWQPVAGARLGIEYAFGQRYDKGGDRGNANRVSMLLYYDF